MGRYQVNQTQFQYVKDVETERSVFDRSYDHKTTMQTDKLVPFYLMEVLPGDSISMQLNAYIRMLCPLAAPIYDNLYFDTFYFFVPLRLVWENAQRFFGERDPDPDSSIDYTIPKIRFTSGHEHGLHSLSDYFGCPVSLGIQSGQVEWNALPYRAYAKIINAWFRRQDISDSLVVPLGNGPDIVGTITYDTVQTRLKRRDYFTSCLTDPQKGDAVELPPISNTVPVIGNGKALGFEAAGGTTFAALGKRAGANPGFLEYYVDAVDTNVGTTVSNGFVAGSTQSVGVSQSALHSGLEADFSSVVMPLVNELRECIAVQRFREREMRAGSRYIEINWSMFHVRSDDARLQRPEYLGGSSDPINVAPVQQTAPDPGQVTTSSVGTLKGFAYGAYQKHGFNHSFVEHGYVMGICNIRSEITYQGGLPKMFQRESRFDFPWPVFAHLGEQPVLKGELCYTNTATDAETFGYNEQYADRRYCPSIVTGAFRSVHGLASLDYWHLSPDFDFVAPTLGESFLRANTPIERIMAYDNENLAEWVVDCYFKQKHAQVLPMFGDPGYMDHF